MASPSKSPSIKGGSSKPSKVPTAAPTGIRIPTYSPTFVNYHKKYVAGPEAFFIFSGAIVACTLVYIIIVYIKDVWFPEVETKREVEEGVEMVESSKIIVVEKKRKKLFPRLKKMVIDADTQSIISAMAETAVTSQTKSNSFVIDLFERNAVNYPTRPALVLEDGKSLDFSQLNSLASKIQQIVYHINKSHNSLRDDGEFDTPLISVMIDRNFSFIVAMLGILKAGAGYVPVDPAFPPDRQVYIFSHSKCSFVIIDEECHKSATALGIELPPYIKMDADGNIIGGTIPGVSFPNSGLSYSNDEIKLYRHKFGKDRLAYVLYTSGSTGKPKGVMVKNVGVVNIINWFADALKVGPHSRVMGLTTFCFDISVLEMCMPLTRGGVLVLGKSSSQKDPFTLLEVMEKRGVTVFQATPTTYEMMLATGWTGDKSIDFLVSFVF